MAPVLRCRLEAARRQAGGNRGPSLSLGDQVEAEWLPLLGIAYDPKDDLVEVALEGLDHLIYKPREIYLENGAGELASLDIVDADGVHQVVKLKDQLLLPAPKS